MQRDAQLVLWLAGNQFFAMDDVVQAFQALWRRTPASMWVSSHSRPDLLLEAIEKGGWVYGGIGIRDCPTSMRRSTSDICKNSGRPGSRSLCDVHAQRDGADGRRAIRRT
jgi:hypothetical protein